VSPKKDIERCRLATVRWASKRSRIGIIALLRNSSDDYERKANVLKAFFSAQTYALESFTLAIRDRPLPLLTLDYAPDCMILCI
jgi:hypothetical protein